MRVVLALLFFLASGSQAFAVIKFCNKFKYPIRFALAYPTVNGWVSQGWTTVKPDGCEIDKRFSHLTGFYYYAQTEPIDTGDGKTSTWSWGNKRAFAVKDGDFKFADAETKPKGARLVEFSGPFSFNLASTVTTLTIEEGSGTFSTPKDDNVQ